MLRSSVIPLACLALVACVPYETERGMFEAETVAKEPAPEVVPDESGDQGAAEGDAVAETEGEGPDTEAKTEGEGEGDAEGELDTTDPMALALLAMGTGDEAPEPEAEPVEAPTAAPVAPTPAMPTVSMRGMVRVVSTVPSAQPPRAILGLGDGTEVVVRPGDLLPEAGVAVVAIGADAVQIVEVVPSGDSATLVPRTLPALYPSHRPQ